MIAIRPPEYFPRLAYAALMMAADRFVLADTFQYSRQSFQNRTRVRNPQGWQWVSVPLKGGQHGKPACDVAIRQVPGWRRSHWRAFTYNYRRSPFFAYYEPQFAPLFERRWTRLADLTCATVLLLHRLLELPTTVLRASDMEGRPGDLRDVLRVSGTAPLLVPGESAAYDAAQVDDLRVLRYEHPRYHQVFEGFEQGMTAFDVLFNYGPEARTIIQEGLRIESYTPD
jgi:hypothetical protein